VLTAEADIVRTLEKAIDSLHSFKRAKDLANPPSRVDCVSVADRERSCCFLYKLRSRIRTQVGCWLIGVTRLREVRGGDEFVEAE
jgi:hypothetical protein